MSGLQRILATVICSTLGSIVVMAMYSQAVDLYMPTSAWIATALCPILIATPVSVYLVRQAERVRQLNDDLRLAYARLSRLAAIDDLTGLANRRSFLESASALRRPGDWLLLADIDHFKSVNDRFGHERGDAFLAATAQALRETLRPDDLVGRLGGEEFAMLLRQAMPAEALGTAEMLRERIASLTLQADDGRTIATSVSVGLAPCSEQSTLQDDFKRADEALYRAKTDGRDRVRLSDEDGAGPNENSPLAMAS